MTREDGFIVRISLPEQNGTLLRQALQLTNKLLISASVFWDKTSGRLVNPGTVVGGDAVHQQPAWDGCINVNVALDSAGYTAHKHWGGAYPWSVRDYADLAVRLEPAWWAQMDYCCEPEIARDRCMETTWKILETWAVLEQLEDQAGRPVVQDPLPVIQGWRPDDYCNSACFAMNYAQKQDRSFPWLMGVGSVCRRRLDGPDGIMAIVDALDRELPDGVELHFFGVEGAAIRELSQHPRAASTDSMAWDQRASWEAHESGARVNIHDRARNLAHWYRQQLRHLRPRRPQPEQARLFG